MWLVVTRALPCGKWVKPQVNPDKHTHKNCGYLVGEVFKTSHKTSYKQQNPHLSTSYPQLGVTYCG
jgi:hypothetical protein